MDHDALLDALGDRTRRGILELLRSGPRPVVEIARELPVGRPAVSQHLKVLKDAGLVTDRPAGTRRVYQINPDGLAELEAYVAVVLVDRPRPLPASRPAQRRRTRRTSDR